MGFDPQSASELLMLVSVRAVRFTIAHVNAHIDLGFALGTCVVYEIECHSVLLAFSESWRIMEPDLFIGHKEVDFVESGFDHGNSAGRGLVYQSLSRLKGIVSIAD